VKIANLNHFLYLMPIIQSRLCVIKHQNISFKFINVAYIIIWPTAHLHLKPGNQMHFPNAWLWFVKLSYSLSCEILNLRSVSLNLTLEKMHSDAYNPRTHNEIISHKCLWEQIYWWWH